MTLIPNLIGSSWSPADHLDMISNWYKSSGGIFTDYAGHGAGNFSSFNLTTGTKNGNETLIFNGTTSYLDNSSYLNQWSGTIRQFPWYKIFALKKTGTSKDCLFACGVVASSNNWDFVFYNGASQNIFYSTDTGTAFQITDGTFIPNDLDAIIILGIDNNPDSGNTSFLECYIVCSDGTTFYNKTTYGTTRIIGSNVIGGAGALTREVFGQWITSNTLGGYFFNGTLYESLQAVGTADGLTSVDWSFLNNIGNYLAAKWNINYINR